MRAVTFDGAIPRYLATKAAGLVSDRLLTGPGRCTRLQDVAEPSLPGPDWVKVRTRLGGICGSDLNLVRLDVSPSTSPFSTFPFVIGHENVGEIAAVGSAVSSVAVGDRVVVNPLLSCVPRGITPVCRHCAGGMPSRCENFTGGALPAGMLMGTTAGLGGSWGDYYVAHASQLVRVPEAVDDRAAVLLEPFATVISPILAHPPRAGERVLVLGAGSIGLLTVAALEALCPEAEVTVLVRHRFQAEHAERLGAEHVVMQRGGDYFAELSRLSAGRLLKPILGPRIHVGGFDRTFVCVGTSAAVDDALRFTAGGGTVVLLGNVARLPKVDWTPLWLKELSVHGSLCYNTHAVHAHGGDRRPSFDVGLDLLARGLAGALVPLVTHVFPLAEFDRALTRSLDKSHGPSIKIAFDLTEA